MSGYSDERPAASPLVVVHIEVCCVWLEFRFLPFSYWGAGGGGRLVCESVRKAKMLSAHFDAKQCSCGMVFLYSSVLFIYDSQFLIFP